MANNIIAREKNFAQWYQDVITAGKLADHSPVKGCMVIRPTGYAIWESIQQKLDLEFKKTGHVNAYFPLLIPENFIQKEAEHVEGFAPELAVVTQAGNKTLEENYVIRPTSEAIIGHMYAKWINSYRDLPVLINQWCNVMRWEMRTRLFLRTSEFLWQEGHTAHETDDEAQTETIKMIHLYRDFLQNVCAIPVHIGQKPAHEKFPGAQTTYTVEAMMQDGKALQAGTSHNLGQNFAKAFEIKFLDRQNQHVFAHTTSWGVSTRLIGGIIMTHSDDDGLILPPHLAPTQVVIVPIFKPDNKNNILTYTDQIADELKKVLGDLKVQVDYRENLRPAEKFFSWIQQGVPLRIEIGPKDMENNGVTLVRRDNSQKTFYKKTELQQSVPNILKYIQKSLWEKACLFRQEKTHTVENYSEFKNTIENGGFIYAHWDGTSATAKKIQEETKATIRLIPEGQNQEPGQCMVTGKASQQRVLFATAY